MGGSSLGAFLGSCGGRRKETSAGRVVFYFAGILGSGLFVLGLGSFLVLRPTSPFNTGTTEIISRNHTNSSSSSSSNASQEVDLALPTETERQKRLKCCFYPENNLHEKFSLEYFEYEHRNYPLNPVPFTGKQFYQRWARVEERHFPWLRNDNDDDNNRTNDDDPARMSDCRSQWALHALDANTGLYLWRYMDQLERNGTFGKRWFPFAEEENKVDYSPSNSSDGDTSSSRRRRPRLLYLGDSISIHAAYEAMREMYKEFAYISGPPCNCEGFYRYDEDLEFWLGDCPWDLVQFNVGHHFRPNKMNLTESEWPIVYQQGLERIISTIRNHSPNTKIVVALTTPSPMDSSATIPKRTNCKNYNLFPPAGYVPTLNRLARQVASNDSGVTINDRYSAVYPNLKKLQNYCDIHYSHAGDITLAKQDWAVASALLGLSNRMSG